MEYVTIILFFSHNPEEFLASPAYIFSYAHPDLLHHPKIGIHNRCISTEYGI